MSKNQYIVTPRNETAVVVVGLDIQCTGTAVTVMTCAPALSTGKVPVK